LATDPAGGVAADAEQPAACGRREESPSRGRGSVSATDVLGSALAYVNGSVLVI
jgi:hypothetical protein